MSGSSYSTSSSATPSNSRSIGRAQKQGDGGSQPGDHRRAGRPRPLSKAAQEWVALRHRGFEQRQQKFIGDVASVAGRPDPGEGLAILLLEESPVGLHELEVQLVVTGEAVLDGSHQAGGLTAMILDGRFVASLAHGREHPSLGVETALQVLHHLAEASRNLFMPAGPAVVAASFGDVPAYFDHVLDRAVARLFRRDRRLWQSAALDERLEPGLGCLVRGFKVRVESPNEDVDRHVRGPHVDSVAGVDLIEEAEVVAPSASVLGSLVGGLLRTDQAFDDV